ncbi:MAG: hypothetical protein GEU98_16500 [Pseudonocardiaceae bacterium]|nr:hypothetical protein [Pseudonocardiaceae bacterium]
MASPSRFESITRFCGNADRGCPELFVDHCAPPDRTVVIIDDFGQRIQLSLAQLNDLVSDVKGGALDRLVDAERR